MALKRILLGLLLALAAPLAAAASGEQGHGAKEADHEKHGHGAEQDVHETEGHGDQEEGHEEHGHGAEEGGSNAGPGLAVEAYADGRIKLSEAAVRRVGIVAVRPKSGPKGLGVPVEALVHVEGAVFVFVLEDGWYVRRPLTLAAKGQGWAWISRGLRPADRVVTEGASTLRAAELDQSSGEAGHGH